MREKNKVEENKNGEIEINKKQAKIKEEQLEKIGKEIDNNKSKNNKKNEKKYKDIVRNISIAIFIVIYFALLLFGKDKISTIDYITTLKAIIIFDLIVTIVLFEVAFKKDNFSIGMHGIEMMFVGGFTILILELFSKENQNINIYFSTLIGLISAYYIVKSIVLAARKRK